MSSTEAPSPEVVIGVEGVSIRYGRTTVLEDVSFSLRRGAIGALLGRNGAGKSSMVRCLLGQQKPAMGRVRLFGEDAWATRQRAMARVGVVPEEPDAPPEMTVRDLEAFCRSLYPRWDRVGFHARLGRLDVPTDVPFGRLSKGQKGAVMLALCLAPAPELLVLDDPTLGLDVVAKRAFYDELISDLADRGVTVLVATHDLTGIEGLASRIAILRERHLVVDEEHEILKARFRRLRCRAPREWAPFEVASLRHRDWGDDAVITNFDDKGLRAFQAREGALDLEVEALSLEELFLAVAGELREAS